MFLLAPLLITITIASYAVLKYYFGTRIYFSDSFFLTIREVMLPLLVISFEIFSQVVLGYSQLPWMILFSCIIGVTLLLVKKGNHEFSLRQYLYQFFSLEFLVFVMGHLLLVIQYCFYLLLSWGVVR